MQNILAAGTGSTSPRAQLPPQVPSGQSAPKSKFITNKKLVKDFLNNHDQKEADETDLNLRDKQTLKTLDWFATPLYQHFEQLDPNEPLLKSIIKTYNKIFTL